MSSRRRRLIVGAAALALAGGLAYLPIALRRPSHDRHWTRDQALLPFAEIEGDQVRLHNVRDCRYRSNSDYDVRHHDRVFRIDAVETAWFAVVPFAGQEALAHTFVSFGLGDRTYVAISVEIRKELGESYSPLRGLFREYEIMYVVADERDVIRLRSNIRRDDVYLYPIRAPREKIRRMLLGMLARANRLAREPEFYNTLTNNCTTSVARHVNDVSPGRVPFSWRLVLPGLADHLAYDLGLIDTDLPFEGARRRFWISGRARACPEEADFSAAIRRVDGPA